MGCCGYGGEMTPWWAAGLPMTTGGIELENTDLQGQVIGVYIGQRAGQATYRVAGASFSLSIYSPLFLATAEQVQALQKKYANLFVALGEAAGVDLDRLAASVIDAAAFPDLTFTDADAKALVKHNLFAAGIVLAVGAERLAEILQSDLEDAKGIIYLLEIAVGLRESTPEPVADEPEEQTIPIASAPQTATPEAASVEGPTDSISEEPAVESGTDSALAELALPENPEQPADEETPGEEGADLFGTPAYDFTQLSGIGPKGEEKIHGAGIVTKQAFLDAEETTLARLLRVGAGTVQAWKNALQELAP